MSPVSVITSPTTHPRIVQAELCWEPEEVFLGGVDGVVVISRSAPLLVHARDGDLRCDLPRALHLTATLWWQAREPPIWKVKHQQSKQQLF